MDGFESFARAKVVLHHADAIRRVSTTFLPGELGNALKQQENYVWRLTKTSDAARMTHAEHSAHRVETKGVDDKYCALDLSCSEW